MVMETIAVSKFKATCLKLLTRIKKTQTSILITKKGEPLALVSPPPAEKSRKDSFGCMKGTVTFVGDIISPLGTEDWEVFKK